MATKYELPEESNLGKDEEMKTFKTNVRPTLEYGENQRLFIKILCVGDYTGGVGGKGVFISDYQQVTPPVPTNQYPVVGFALHQKTIKWKKGDQDHNPITIGLLQFWEIGENDHHRPAVSVKRSMGLKNEKILLH